MTKPAEAEAEAAAGTVAEAASLAACHIWRVGGGVSLRFMVHVPSPQLVPVLTVSWYLSLVSLLPSFALPLPVCATLRDKSIKCKLHLYVQMTQWDDLHIS